MKKLLLTSLILSFVCLVSAQTVDIQNRMLINRYKLQNDGLIPTDLSKNALTRGADQIDLHNMEALISIADGYSISDLEELGITVISSKGNFASVIIDSDNLDFLSHQKCIKKISLAKPLTIKTDKTRTETGVDKIHSGKELDLPYTGKNVAGVIFDTGFDPNHVAFKDENGENRVEYLVHYDRNGNPNRYGREIEYVDEDGNNLMYPDISEFTTEDASETHGTATSNIFGGAYKGNITVKQANRFREIPNSYYGMAPGIDLLIGCGPLSTANILNGLTELTDYNRNKDEENQRPVVVNLSLGNNLGAHDPNDVFNKYLEEIGKEAIVVISAGNEGDQKIALKKTFTPTDNVLQSLIYPVSYRYSSTNGAPSKSNTYVRDGSVIIISQDATPFTVRCFIMTGQQGSYQKIETLDLTPDANSYFKYYVSDSSYQKKVDGSINQNLKKYFSGYIGGGTMLDQDLNRYYCSLDFYLTTEPSTGMDARGNETAIVGFEIIGENGQRIECYGDGNTTEFSDYYMIGFQDGSPDGTINDLAVGRNVISVGAYNTRSYFTAFDGNTYAYPGLNDGNIDYYSSYGTMADGHTLPHVCAPGSAIISANSSYYTDKVYGGNQTLLNKNVVASCSDNGRNYYWTTGMGTSFSAPAVAGGIALWLEADPSLTFNDVYDIIEKTSVKDKYVNGGNKAKWGAGKFNALAGLKEVIKRREDASVSMTFDDRNDRLIIEKEPGGLFNIFVGAAKTLKIDVYSISGSKVLSKSAAGNETNLNLSNLSPGIYILKVNNHTSKIII